MRVVLSVLLLVVAVALAAGQSTAGAKQVRCVREGESAMRITEQLVVIKRRGRERADLACVRRTGARTTIGDSAGSLDPPGLISVAGLVVASSTAYCSDGRYEEPVSCEPVVERLDLRSRPEADFAFAAGEVTDVLACPGARVVFLTRNTAQLAFGKTLAVRSDLDPTSLRRVRGRAVWSARDGSRAGAVRCS